MHYTDEDYARLYNTGREHEKSRELTWWEFLILAAFAVGAGFTREADDAEFTAEAEQVALEKKQAVLSMPCTWVAQCAHEPCRVDQRRCTKAADLRVAP